jgi:hypothetical protein
MQHHVPEYMDGHFGVCVATLDYITRVLFVGVCIKKRANVVVLDFNVSRCVEFGRAFETHMFDEMGSSTRFWVFMGGTYVAERVDVRNGHMVHRFFVY